MMAAAFQYTLILIQLGTAYIYAQDHSLLRALAASVFTSNAKPRPSEPQVVAVSTDVTS